MLRKQTLTVALDRGVSEFDQGSARNNTDIVGIL